MSQLSLEPSKEAQRVILQTHFNQERAIWMGAMTLFDRVSSMERMDTLLDYVIDLGLCKPLQPPLLLES